MSAMTENIQARYVSQWLTTERVAAGTRTAIVLCDESLLESVIHQLPETVTKANITMGYPLKGTPMASLVEALLNMLINGRRKRGNGFLPRYVNAVLHHPYAAFLSDECRRAIEADAMACVNDTAKALQWMAGLLLDIRGALPLQLHEEQDSEQVSSHNLMRESVFRMYQLLNRLLALTMSGDLTVDIITLHRLLVQLIGMTSIPFSGEPAEGVQIMGVLETRNLDFDHVLLLSANDGNMPKGVNDASFIPYNVRRAYGLTTVDNKVAVYAYYFYRLLQRASDITISYNSSTSDGTTGEQSRFMLQLLVEWGNASIRHSMLSADSMPSRFVPRVVPKTPAVMDVLRAKKHISPSQINTYLRCPVKYYFKSVVGLQEPNDEEDGIDNRQFGSIFHAAAQKMYTSVAESRGQVADEGRVGDDIFNGGFIVEKGDIDRLKNDPKLLERFVDESMREVLTECGQRPSLLEQDGMMRINRAVIVRYLQQLLAYDGRHVPFRILGMECKLYDTVEVRLADSGETQKISLGGIIDRLDEVSDDSGTRWRVVDYKTGSRPSREPKGIDEVFNPAKIKECHTDYYLQTLLYSLLVANHSHEKVSPALLFVRNAQGNNYNPTLRFDEHPILDVGIYRDDFREHLQVILSEMLSPGKFEPNTANSQCEVCPFRSLCGG